MREKGIGTAMVNHCFDNYVNEGDTLIALTMFWNGGFYKALGFKKGDSAEIKKADDIGSRPKHIHCTAFVKTK